VIYNKLVTNAGDIHFLHVSCWLSMFVFPPQGSTSSFAWQAVGSRGSIHATCPKTRLDYSCAHSYIEIYIYLLRHRETNHFYLFTSVVCHLGYISSADTGSISGGQFGRCPWFFLAFYPNQFFGFSVRGFLFFSRKFIGNNHLEFIQIANWTRRKSSTRMGLM